MLGQFYFETADDFFGCHKIFMMLESSIGCTSLVVVVVVVAKSVLSLNVAYEYSKNSGIIQKTLANLPLCHLARRLNLGS